MAKLSQAMNLAFLHNDAGFTSLKSYRTVHFWL